MPQSQREAGRRIGKAVGLFAGAFAIFVIGIAVVALLGLPPLAITFLIVLVTLVAYAVLGVGGATLNETDFFAAGRSVPAAFNGLGAAAAFLSVGGFAGLAGAWFDDGRGALALTLGWAAGLVLIAVLIAPYFRKSGAVTLPDFLAVRFGGRAIRAVALLVLVLIGSVALAAALAAAATVANLFLGVRPSLAIVAAIAMVLFAGAFGGMRGLVFVTGAQATVVLIAFLVPVALVAVREYGLPLAQFTYGYALKEAADAGGPFVGIAGRFLPLPRLDGFNLVALAITVAAGTASLPHLVMRSAATYGPAAARRATGWTLVVVVAVLLTAPAYAAFVKLSLYRDLVATDIGSLPDWVFSYGKEHLVRLCGADAISLDAVAAACAASLGANGVLGPGDIAISSDLVVLGFADIADLPYVMTALIAAGALAAALAGATALAVAIANAIGHDLYGRLIAPKAPAGRRLILTRLVLALVVCLAGWLAAKPPGGLFGLAALAPTIAASAFFPALVLGIWWRRANAAGVLAGMIAGLTITAYYAVVTAVSGAPPAGFPSLGGGVSPMAAATYGLPIGFLVIVGVSLASAAPDDARDDVVDAIRSPGREPVASNGGSS
jgi:cation/acetate symporter